MRAPRCPCPCTARAPTLCVTLESCRMVPMISLSTRASSCSLGARRAMPLYTHIRAARVARGLSVPCGSCACDNRDAPRRQPRSCPAPSPAPSFPGHLPAAPRAASSGAGSCSRPAAGALARDGEQGAASIAHTAGGFTAVLPNTAQGPQCRDIPSETQVLGSSYKRADINTAATVWLQKV